jgi:alpha/beta superfamily hydrolase
VAVEPLRFDTADGLVLAGELARAATATGAAVVCHPHPLYGGDMHNHVVEAIVGGLATAGATTLRFDFRGVGRSQGRHGGGVDERLDVAAAIDAVAPFAGHGPLLLAGYSFGALVALEVIDERVDGWFAVAAPIGDGAVPLAAADHRPKTLLVPAHDQFAPPDVIERRTAGWVATERTTVPMADHFLAGGSARVADAAAAAFRAMAAR